MIQEKLEHKKIGSIIGVLYVLMIVVAVFALYIFINFIAFLAKIPWLVYVMYALLVVAATIIIKKRLTDYSYGIAQGELLVDRISSRNPKNLLSIPIKSILWFGDCKDIPEGYATVKLGKVTFLKENVSKAVIFKRDKFTHGMMFTPSDEFSEKLIERMEKAKKKGKTSKDGAEDMQNDAAEQNVPEAEQESKGEQIDEQEHN